MRQNAGSIPVDHMGIRKLLERAVEILHGPEMIAPIEHTRDGPGLEYQEDGETHVAARMEIVRGGVVIPYDVNTQRWKDGQDQILTALRIGTLTALVSHPDTGREYTVPEEYWMDGMSDLAFASGVYDVAKDLELRGCAIYFREAAAERFLDDLQGVADGVDPAFFNETYWSLLQAVVWIFTRNRALVCETSPRRETFGSYHETHTVSDGTQRTVRVTSHPDHFWAAIAGDHVSPRPLEKIEDAESDLRQRLTDGELTMLGQFRDEGTHKDIPATDWLSLKFQWGDDGRPDWVGVNPHSKMQGGTYWTALMVKRETVLGLWPEDWNEAATDQEPPPQNDPPTNAGANLPKALPDKKAEREWMDQLAKRIRDDGSIILKPRFLELYLGHFPRAPKKHAMSQYGQLPSDVRHDPLAGRVSSEQKLYQGE